MSIWEFFSPQGKIYKFLDTMGNLLIWNFSWIVCSLPLITIGASTCALYQMNFRQTEDRHQSCLEYFKYFKENLKFGFFSELIIVIFVATSIAWGIFLRANDVSFLIVLIVYAVILMFAMVLSYLLPTGAYFSGNFSQLMKISVYLALRMPLYFVAKVMILAIVCILMYGMLCNYATILLPLLILFCFSGVNLLNAKLYLSILKKQNFIQRLYKERDEK